ncbi:hypothetical protein [Streptomyces sp. NPDC048496]|uniref:hypothetical protein n=1 Tax=Streptomyces sp. NPDC048496 TaxID=3365558 RepID=UPI0037116107
MGTGDLRQCAGCQVERLTPGIAPDGGRLCTDCAGGLGDFHCELCGREALRYELGTCGNCVLAERLREFLHDGTGSIRAELIPLFDEVRQTPRPRNALSWVAQPHVQLILRALAHDEVPLTHDGLSQLSPARSVAHIRDLLMASGVLPQVDRHLTDLDAWHAENATGRRTAQAFLRWCADNHAMPRLKIPTCRTENPAPISQHRRITLIRRVLTDEELLLADRVAAALVLLYAQPVSRLVRLTTSDIVRDGGQVMLRLGDPAAPVPEPFAGMLLNHLAAQPNSTWLFPGHRAGQPLDPLSAYEF